MDTVVVYVHGLWLRGHEAVLLRRRIGRALGARTLIFAYASVGASVPDNAAALRRYLASLSADTVHLVAHSLGGLVILELFGGLTAGRAEGAGAVSDGAPAMPPGRVVLLGAPVQGSLSARRFARWPGGLRLMGGAGGVLPLPAARRWSGARELGVIAGNRALGLGRVLGPMQEPNDGTVLVRETRLPGATEHLTLPVSHSGMPFSASVAVQATEFLRCGRFSRPAASV